MSLLGNIENFISTTEADVKSIWLKIVQGVEVAAKDVNAALNWIAGQAPAIAADVKEVETLIEQLEASIPGFSQNAAVTTAIAEANAAVAGLNAFATAANAGSNNAAAVVSGIAGYYASTAAVASANAAVSAAANSNTAGTKAAA